MSILLADDDPVLATFLSKGLELEGYSVHTALDESTVLAELERQNYKLIILDLNFGQTDGLELLQRLRVAGLKTPVIVLSGRNLVSDRIQSLNLGADDYITKPCFYQEVAARANAILRRKTDPSLSLLRVEDLELDPALRKVRRGKHDIKLSPKEFGLLQLLMRHAGETVSRQELLKEAWRTQETDSNLVDVYVNYLRKKVDSFSAEKLIQTVRGAGYRLGRPAPTGSGIAGERNNPAASRPANALLQMSNDGVPITFWAMQNTLRSIIQYAAHDMVQPLNSARLYVGSLAIPSTQSSATGAALRTIAQQTDRAIALAVGIRAIAGEAVPEHSAWMPAETVLSDVLNVFALVIGSGFLTVELKCDPSVQITSSPALRQLLVLFVTKLFGRNSGPLKVTVSAAAQEGICELELRWEATEAGHPVANVNAMILDKELPGIKELAYFIGSELVLPKGQPFLTLRLPAAPQANMAVAV